MDLDCTRNGSSVKRLACALGVPHGDPGGRTGLTERPRSVARELDGPQVALAEVDGLPLEGYHAFHATRADLLRRLGRSEQSRAAYDRAIGLAGNTAETAYLIRRRDQLAGP
jgi:RNA polymerase sigma-70 factor (ECF subfamily)